MMMRVGVVMIMMVMVMVMMVTEAGREVRQASRCSPREPCTPLRTCRSFQDLLRRPDSATLRRIQDAICNSDRRNVRVCCPGGGSIILPVNNTGPAGGEALLPDTCGRFTSPRAPTAVRRRQQTGVQGSGVSIQPGLIKPGLGDLSIGGGTVLQPAVVGGEDVQVTQPLSWMALLGYNSRTSPIWACGGSLITSQYVVTAAHCVHASFTLGLTLQVIRLGEQNLRTNPDCSVSGRSRVCAPPPQDFSPAEILLHPAFNKRTRVSDDIALIRLDRKANFGQFIFPLCLPPAGQSALELVGSRVVDVSGWGLNETSGASAQILQKASLPYFDKAECNRLYNNTLISEQLCFGGGEQDSCQGDSGGPIFIRRSLAATLIGVVSRGLDIRCGTKGVPAIYTDVTAYRPWIISNLKP